MSETNGASPKEQYLDTKKVSFFCVKKMDGTWFKEKIFVSKFPFRVNSGHPLFIGYGRTGESPILHTKSSEKRAKMVRFSLFLSIFLMQKNFF